SRRHRARPPGDAPRRRLARVGAAGARRLRRGLALIRHPRGRRGAGRAARADGIPDRLGAPRLRGRRRGSFRSRDPRGRLARTKPARGRPLGRALFHWHGLPAPLPHQLPPVSHILAGHGAPAPQSRPGFIVYVSGATGFVGSHVARELRAQGAEVRDERVDLLDSDGLEHVLGGCDAVVHVAALYSYGAPDSEFQRVNVEGTRTILAAARAKGVRRFLFTSTAGTCGPLPGPHQTEEAHPPQWELSVPYKRTKLESERLALAAGAVVVNPTTPVGDGDAKPTPTGQMVEDVATGRIRAYVGTTGLNVVDVR